MAMAVKIAVHHYMCLVAQSCQTLSDPMDCSPPGSAIHGIFQARVLEWGAIASPITSWQIDGETMETLTDFISLGSKITEDGDCSHEIKRHLLFGRKAMTNLDSILKNQVLLTKICLAKALVFPVFMYGCESWAVMKAEC